MSLWGLLDPECVCGGEHGDIPPSTEESIWGGGEVCALYACPPPCLALPRAGSVGSGPPPLLWGLSSAMGLKPISPPHPELWGCPRGGGGIQLLPPRPTQTIQIMTGFMHIGFGIVLTTLTNVYTSVFVIGEIPFLGGVSVRSAGRGLPAVPPPHMGTGMGLGGMPVLWGRCVGLGGQQLTAPSLPVQFIISGCLSIGAEKSPTECAVSVPPAPILGKEERGGSGTSMGEPRWGEAVSPFGSGAEAISVNELFEGRMMGKGKEKKHPAGLGTSPFCCVSRAAGGLGGCWGPGASAGRSGGGSG